MTGPEHYRQAEDYLAEAVARSEAGHDGSEFRELALIHATLAHAGATAMTGAGSASPSGAVRMQSADREAWRAVTGAEGS